jgi:hypothetical protein
MWCVRDIVAVTVSVVAFCIHTCCGQGTEATTVTPPPCYIGQHFDAGSFIGGITLAVGITAISIFGYKYYKYKTGSSAERSYHDL